MLALANYPSYSPDDRQNLTGEQLRNRALTDMFEPGSTMKPFIVALGARDRPRHADDRRSRPRPARSRSAASTITDSHPHGVLTVSEVIQKSSNIGATQMAHEDARRSEMWEMYTAVGFGQKPQISFPGAVTGRLRPYKTWRPIEQATMSLRLRPVGVAVPDRARLHRVRARRRAHSGPTRARAAPSRARPGVARVLAEDRVDECATCCRW